MASKLTKDGRTGLYRRDVGYLQSKTQPRFYLGRKKDVAELVSKQLECIWGFQCELLKTTQWQEPFLSIARAVAKGEEAFLSQDCFSRHDALDIVASLRRIGIVVHLQNEEVHVKRRKRIAVVLRDAGESMAADGFGQTLHQALKAYQTWQENRSVDVSGRTTLTGKKNGERAATLLQRI